MDQSRRRKPVNDETLDLGAVEPKAPAADMDTVTITRPYEQGKEYINKDIANPTRSARRKRALEFQQIPA